MMILGRLGGSVRKHLYVAYLLLSIYIPYLDPESHGKCSAWLCIRAEQSKNHIIRSCRAQQGPVPPEIHHFSVQNPCILSANLLSPAVPRIQTAVSIESPHWYSKSWWDHPKGCPRLGLMNLSRGYLLRGICMHNFRHQIRGKLWLLLCVHIPRHRYLRAVALAPRRPFVL